MSLNLTTLPAFGQCARDEAWARIRKKQATLNASAARIAVAIALVALLIAVLIADSVSLLIDRSDAHLWVLPGVLGSGVKSLPWMVGPVLFLPPIGFLIQFLVWLVRLSMSAEPIVFIDYTGIAIRSASGWQIFLWDEVAEIRRWPGFVRMKRVRRGIMAAGLEANANAFNVTIPTLFMVGGEDAFADALMDVRPELARSVFGNRSTG